MFLAPRMGQRRPFVNIILDDSCPNQLHTSDEYAASGQQDAQYLATHHPLRFTRPVP